MPSDRTNVQRYNEACSYLENLPNGGMELKNAVVAATRGREDLLGGKLSIEGQGLRLIGTDAQHQAVKALVLCELAFNTKPHIPDKDIQGMSIAEISDTDISTTKRNFLVKTKSSVDEEIRHYMLASDRSYQKLCDAARRVRNAGTESIPLWRKKRSENYFSDGAFVICYDGVKMWLFAAGMVSRRWLSSVGITLDANTSKAVFGQGTAVPPSQWDSIEPGFFWSIEKKRADTSIDTKTCHWGLSLGGGLVVATNNTYATAGPNRELIQLQFVDQEGPGNTWGISRFKELCNILNRDFKYRSTDSTADPTSVDQHIHVCKYDPMSLVGAC